MYINIGCFMNRKGAVMPIVAVGMVLFLGMAAISIDAGIAYHSRVTLQNACDLAALSAASMLGESADPEIIHAEVMRILLENGVDPAEAEVDVNISSSAETVFVKGKRRVDFYFARIFGAYDAELKVDSLARYNADGTTSLIEATSYDLVPWGVPREIWDFDVNTGFYYAAYQNADYYPGYEYILKLGREYLYVSPEEYDRSDFGYSVVQDAQEQVAASGDLMPWGLLDLTPGEPGFGYVPGQEYEIKSSPGGGGLLAPGNFGCLNLVPDHGHGGGANVYRDNIMYGYAGPVNVGDQFYPQTGNIAGPTETAVNYRLDNGLTSIRIPVVSPYPAGQSQQITILGFLDFELVGTGIEGQGANAKATVRAVYTGPADEQAAVDYSAWNVGGNPAEAAVLLRPKHAIGYKYDRTFDLKTLVEEHAASEDGAQIIGSHVSVTIEPVMNGHLVNSITLDNQQGYHVTKTYPDPGHPLDMLDQPWSIDMASAWVNVSPGTEVDFLITADFDWQEIIGVEEETGPGETPAPPTESGDPVTKQNGSGGYSTTIVSVEALDGDSYRISLRVEHDGSKGINDRELSHYSVEALPGTYSDVSFAGVAGVLDMGPNLGSDPFDGFKIDSTSGIGDGMAGSFTVEYTLSGGLQNQQTSCKAGPRANLASFTIADFEAVLGSTGGESEPEESGESQVVWQTINHTETVTANFRLVKIRENFGALDLDSVQKSAAKELEDYEQRIKYGFSPALSVGSNVDTLPGVWPETTDDAVMFNINQESESQWDTISPGSPRVVIVPIVSTGHSGFNVQSNEPNVSAEPSTIYDVYCRDRVSVHGYGLFYLEPALAEGDLIDYEDVPDNPRIHSVTVDSQKARHGEVRGTFIGYHVMPIE